MYISGNDIKKLKVPFFTFINLCKMSYSMNSLALKTDYDVGKGFWGGAGTLRIVQPYF